MTDVAGSVRLVTGAERRPGHIPKGACNGTQPVPYRYGDTDPLHDRRHRRDMDSPSRASRARPPGPRFLSGTEFTAPLIFLVLWVGFLVMMSNAGRVATVGLWLMTLFAAVFSFGEVTEFFKKNIGVSAAKWHLILGLAGIWLAVGLAVTGLGITTIAVVTPGPFVNETGGIPFVTRISGL